MFLVEFQNGSLITERETTLKNISDKDAIRMVLLCNNNIIVGLTDMDEYWFSNQAVAAHGGKGNLVAQIVGGKKEGAIVEIVQTTSTGAIGIFHEDKFLIKTDHKNGRRNDEDRKRRDGIFSRLFRGLK